MYVKALGKLKTIATVMPTVLVSATVGLWIIIKKVDMKSKFEYIMSMFKKEPTKIYISDQIFGPESVVEVVEVLRSAKKDEEVHIYLNTPGGCLDSTVQVINAIRESKGNVTGFAEGQIASGGSLIFFSCPTMIVGDHCSFMLHDAHGLDGGTVSDRRSSVEHTSKRLHDLYHDVYSLVCTEEEIDRVLGGYEMYLTSDEVIERLSK